MTSSECVFAGVAFLETNPDRLLLLKGAPEPLRQILRRRGNTLEHEYVRLFLNPGGAPCPPWQSAHEADRTLMGAAHASALQWYSRYGAVPRSEGEPADQIGLLLTFHAQLLLSGEQAQMLRLFAQRHLSWIPAFAEAVSAAARHEFYRELGLWVGSTVSDYLAVTGSTKGR